MASIRHERTEHLAYALYNIPNQSNEDRCATIISHEREGLDSMASFGVFDGHMGASAADACSTQLHGMVALNSRQLSNVVVSKTQNGHQPPPPGSPEDTTPEGMLASYMQTLNQEDLRDLVVCEAIKRAVGELDGEVRRFSNAGTTVASLFLLWDTDDRSRTAHLNNGPAGRISAPVRVYCANMGDSRCVMMRCYDTKEALSLPSTFEPAAKRNGMSVETLGQQMAGMTTSDPAQSSSKENRFVAVHLMTEDHKLQLPRERYRINNTLPASWRVLPADASPIFLPSYARTAPPENFPGVSTVYGDPPSPDKFAAAAVGASNLAIVNNLPPISRAAPQPRNSSLGGSMSLHGSVFGSIKDNLSMSGHGGLEGAASGKRSSGMFGFGRSNSGMSASQHGIGSLHGNTGASAHSEIKDDVGAQGFIFDWGYPPDPVMQAAQAFIRIAAEGVPQAQCAPGACDPNYARNMQAMQEAAAASMKGRSSMSNKNVGFQLSESQHGRGSGKPMTVGEALKDSNYEPPMVNRGSFIQCRTSADGRTVGPEALFGRHNISIMMTRSVGDRYGARSCIAMPEVSAYTVPPNIHVRFVLGSDGFWDVVSMEDVRCVGMIATNSDPRMLAAQLAQKAHRRRDRAKIRMDDITVLVVDVNPNNFVGVSGKAGNDGPSTGGSSLAGRLGKGKWW